MCLSPSSIIASLGTTRNGPCSTTISITYSVVFARPDAASVASMAAPDGLGVARVTDAWYIDDLELGGNARTRWPTFTSAASGPETDPARIFPVLSMVPAIRTQVCSRRTSAVPSVRVSVSACDWVTRVPRGSRRVCSLTFCAAAVLTATHKARMDKAGLTKPALRLTTNHQPPTNLMAVVILAVHDVRAPGVQPDIQH